MFGKHAPEYYNNRLSTFWRLGLLIRQDKCRTKEQEGFFLTIKIVSKTCEFAYGKEYL